MKTLLTLLLTCFGITLFGSDTLFRDEDTGFVMQIPAEAKRTWNLSHCENGIELIVFQNEEESFIAFGKLPLTDVLGEGAEGSYPFVFEELQEMFCGEESVFSIEVLPSLAPEEYAASRMRIRIKDEDEDVCMDLHSFLIGTNSIHIVTYDGSESALDKLTFGVLSSVSIIEEEGQ
ncbi:MAG: hypothetical protein P0S96_00650 [Simkaniaceae bacterium]|nr:hypothetical protein [Candidatus Sacchlamyda saccharinae]